MTDKTKIMKNTFKCSFSNSEKNDHIENNCIVKKVELKISKEICDNDLVSDQKNKILRTGIKHVNSNIGGRLQFFKDGKFIFELARSNKGEKRGWVPVPKTIFENSSVYCRNNKNCQFLNVSDNISIKPVSQHGQKWKQLNPQKINYKISTLFFKRTKNFVLSSDGERLSLKKRRQPLNELLCETPFKNVDYLKCSSLNIKQKLYQSETLENYMVKKNYNSNKKISTVIQKLLEHASNLSTNRKIVSMVHSNLTDNFPCFKDFQTKTHVSPRKRILRELEKVSLEDATKKRRAKDSTSLKNEIFLENSGLPRTTSNVNIDNKSKLKTTNGSSENYDNNCSSSSSKLYSSYSIHSLLGNCKKQVNNFDNYNDFDTSVKTSKTQDLNFHNLKVKQMMVKSVSNSNQSFESMSTASDKILNCNKSKISDTGSLSPLNYSKYFNLDKINNIQSSNQHHQSFPSYFSSPQLLSDLHSNCLQTFPAFESTSLIKDSVVSKEVSLQKGPKISRYSPLMDADMLKKDFSNTQVGSSDVSRKYENKLSEIVNSPHRTNNRMTTPSMLRMYSQSGLSRVSPTFYMPHVSYYHPYATSAMRHQLWMHCQSEVPTDTVARLSPSLFCLNGFNSYSSIDSVHIFPSDQYEERTSSLQPNEKSELPISLCVKDKEDECNSDVPLNLSKH